MWPLGTPRSVFARDQPAHRFARLPDAVFVGMTAAFFERDDVVPRRHHIARLFQVIGMLGACGNTKRTAGVSPRPSAGTIGAKIVAVGAEAMQPDHGMDGLGSGLQFDRRQEVTHRFGSEWGGGAVVATATVWLGKHAAGQRDPRMPKPGIRRMANTARWPVPKPPTW